jgi:hypothetical protein
MITPCHPSLADLQKSIIKSMVERGRLYDSRESRHAAAYGRTGGIIVTQSASISAANRPAPGQI